MSSALKTHSILEPYFERTRGLIEPGAHRLQMLLSKWIPENVLNQTSILVTGSNGKGSTVAYLERMFRHHGFKTGLYTSPHLVHPNERIRLCGVPICEETLAQTLLEIEEERPRQLPNATFFEILTACALLIFKRAGIDILICEVGLGGHFDSTNAIAPTVSVLTSVALEHTEMLGNTVREIARDKTHIARRNRPFICAELNSEALAGVQDTISKIGARLVLTETTRDPMIEKILEQMREHSPNLRTALYAFLAFQKEHGLSVQEVALRESIENTFWPGRFDARSFCNHTLIFDAAHNPAGFDFFQRQYQKSQFAQRPYILLFASLNDKDWRSTLTQLNPVCNHVVLTQFESHRACAVENFSQFLESTPLHKSFCYDIFPKLDDALEKVLSFDPNLPVVITGSIAFIGTVMHRLNIEVFPRDA